MEDQGDPPEPIPSVRPHLWSPETTSQRSILNRVWTKD